MNTRKTPASRQAIGLLMMGAVVATLGLVFLGLSIMNGYNWVSHLLSALVMGVGFLLTMMFLRRRRASGASF
jgi:hypothetical protein